MHTVRRGKTFQVFQVSRSARADSITWPDWMQEAWHKEIGSAGSLYPADFPNSTPDSDLIAVTASGAKKLPLGGFLLRDDATGALTVETTARYQSSFVQDEADAEEDTSAAQVVEEHKLSDGSE